MKKEICLNDIQPGQKAVVRELRSDGSIHRRLLDIGLVRGTKVECVGKEPRRGSGGIFNPRSSDCNPFGRLRGYPGSYFGRCLIWGAKK